MEIIIITHIGQIVNKTLCSPNENFGKLNKPIDETFRSTFQGREYLIWATNRWKVLRKDSSNVSFSLPKSSFGEHKLLNHFSYKGKRKNRTMFFGRYYDGPRPMAQSTIFTGWYHDDVSQCLSKSQHGEIMMMCLSKSQDKHVCTKPC